MVVSLCDKMMRSLSCVGSSHSVKYPVNGRTRYIVQTKIVQPEIVQTKYVDLKRTKAGGTKVQTKHMVQSKYVELELTKLI